MKNDLKFGIAVLDISTTIQKKVSKHNAFRFLFENSDALDPHQFFDAKKFLE